MTVIATVDIETLPNMKIPDPCKPQFDASEVKTGNMKDQAKIDAKIEEARNSFESDLVKKMSVTPSLAQLSTFVGMKYDTDSGCIIDKVSIQVTKAYDADDLEAVTEGWDFIRKNHMERIPLVSFNGIGFDLPVMWHRAIAQDVLVDPAMYSRLTPRYGGYHHYDLLGILAGWTLDKMKGHNLDFFLNLFGLGSKGGMDGSQVYEKWMLGEYEEIQKYCELDVLNTCNLFKRVEAWVKIEREGV